MQIAGFLFKPIFQTLFGGPIFFSASITGLELSSWRLQYWRIPWGGRRFGGFDSSYKPMETSKLEGHTSCIVCDLFVS